MDRGHPIPRRTAIRSALLIAAMTACDGGAGAPATSPSPPRIATATATGPGAADALSATATSSAVASAPSVLQPSWSWQGADPGFGSSFYRGPVTVETKRGPCRFVYDEKGKSQHVECLTTDKKSGKPERAWGYDEAGAFVEDASLVADEERLFVALFSNISSGCELRAYRLSSGEELWRTRLTGMGSVAHSEYLNEVQIGLMPGKVQVLGWESAGRYVEIVDIGSGRTDFTFRMEGSKTTRVEGQRPPPVKEPPHPGVAGGVTWKWDGPKQSFKPSADTSIPVAGGGRCAFRFASDAKRVHLECTAANKRVWGFDLAEAFVPGAALAADDKRLYFADYSAISTGATVWAFELGSGRVAWKTPLFGVGPIGHSKYRNEVLLRVEGGRVVVSGWESGGKYVEVLDTATGSALGNRKE